MDSDCELEAEYRGMLLSELREQGDRASCNLPDARCAYRPCHPGQLVEQHP